MKLFINLSLAGALLLFLSSCGDAPKGETATTGEQTETMSSDATEGAKEYKVNIEESSIGWHATKLMGGGHKGTLNLSAGNLFVENGDVVGGSFFIDMNSLANTDLEDPNDKADLENHLKSGDFFNVESFPTAVFEITGTTPSAENTNKRQEITGNLRIKGITKSITFFALVKELENSVKISTGNFIIDRTEWGVKYGSGLIGTAKDRVINDKVAMSIELVAN